MSAGRLCWVPPELVRFPHIDAGPIRPEGRPPRPLRSTRRHSLTQECHKLVGKAWANLCEWDTLLCSAPRRMSCNCAGWGISYLFGRSAAALHAGRTGHRSQVGSGEAASSMCLFRARRAMHRDLGRGTWLFLHSMPVPLGRGALLMGLCWVSAGGALCWVCPLWWLVVLLCLWHARVVLLVAGLVVSCWRSAPAPPLVHACVGEFRRFLCRLLWGMFWAQHSCNTTSNLSSRSEGRWVASLMPPRCAH